MSGEYQGAVFRMTQGLESGVSRISLGPDGAIYTGGIGWSGNWGQEGKLKYGLQKLSLNGTNGFDLYRMHAVRGGFEIEYTQPLSEQTAADLAAKYEVQQWRYVATPQYGGPKVDEETLDVTSATLSPDRRKVTLMIAGLKPGHVVYVHSPRPVRLGVRRGVVEHRGLVHAQPLTGHVNLDKLTVTPTKRTVLFDGTDLDAWEKAAGGAATWPVANGSMESAGGDIRTKDRYGDFRMHLDWYEPDYAPEVTGQARGNSSVYIFESYELQVLESHGRPPELNGAGSLYLQKAPDVNAARPTRHWQTYDIEFHAARFDSTGKKVDNARITVWWNGTLIHRDVPITGPTGAGKPEDPAPGKIKLQDHGDPGPNPRFRNIWITRL